MQPAVVLQAPLPRLQKLTNSVLQIHQGSAFHEAKQMFHGLFHLKKVESVQTATMTCWRKSNRELCLYYICIYLYMCMPVCIYYVCCMLHVVWLHVVCVFIYFNILCKLQILQNSQLPEVTLLRPCNPSDTLQGRQPIVGQHLCMLMAQQEVIKFAQPQCAHDDPTDCPVKMGDSKSSSWCHSECRTKKL